ncbi:UNVERIFIED_CONTAM: hypothetical protein GTU68_022080 [Idotea baltica]|nr:hypothetical protein [Idotea baltica]
MGVASVAVYSDGDARSLHVQQADQAVALNGVSAKDSYLDIPKIIAAAQQTGAEAIHPGYGFLSENPDFVDAVDAADAAGLVFIGPSAHAIRAMGLKDAAKALMEKSGVPVVPGYHGEDQGEDMLAAQAAKIGYPVLIKAVAGGGGKGMRRVETPEGFSDALISARREAANAFGNDAVLIEKWITQPRHIEVQVFGDGKDAVHLYERDCSLQRRHQKVIEEAPAPGMTPQMRRAMGDAAVRAAQAIGYKGAGTVEFIVDGSDGLHPDRFWFMEMNTRLQVEHPVTEAVTGIDLVAWQLLVASGQPLPLAQADIPLDGHAFEARLYAEDVPAGFLPATGTLEHLAAPLAARFDTGVQQGDPISPHFDPMMAKIIVQGADRPSALRKLSDALSHTQIAGIATNLDFLQSLACDPAFGRGEVDTGLIERNLETLIKAPEPAQTAFYVAALVASGLDHMPDADQGFHLWHPLRHEVCFRLRGHIHHAKITVLDTDCFDVDLEGESKSVRRIAGGWNVGGQRYGVEIVRTASGFSLFDDAGYPFEIIDPLNRQTTSTFNDLMITAPMPGLVRALSVAVGDHLKAGDPVAILEAMKMEHALKASCDGTIAEIGVAAGDQVDAGALIVRFEGDADG